MAYPASLDSFTANTDGVDDVVAADVNELQTAIVAIETELGTDPAGTATDVKTRLARSLGATGNLQFTATTLLTLSSGAITVAQNFHRLETEGGGASDDLDTINGGAAGLVVVLRLADASHNVVFKHNTGNIYCPLGVDITLDETTEFIVGVYDSDLTKWLVGKSSGNAVTGAATAGQVAYYSGVNAVTGDTGLKYSTTAGLVVNEDGAAAVDTRIESDTESNMIFLDSSADALYLGGTTNGVKILKGGEFSLIGTATQWEDLRIEPVARTTGSNAPTFAQVADNAGLGDTGASRGIYLYQFDDAAAGSEKEVFFSQQMPHAWASTAVYIHVHWIGSVADTTAAPRWALEYAWKDLGQTFAGTTTVYTDGSNYTDVGTDADIVAGKHYISKFAAITPGATQDAISSILIGRLYRDSADAGDTYNAASNYCGLLYIDTHYEVNSLGSTSEYTK